MKDDSISLVHAAVMAMVSSPDFVAELQKRIHAVVPQKQATNSAMDAMRAIRAVINGRGDSVTKVLKCKDILAQHQ